MPPFHLAFPVNDIGAARQFYHELLQCPIGRESERWIDFNFFGHQITAHLSNQKQVVPTNPVDREAVPIRHFGAIIDMDDWHSLVERLGAAGVRFLIAPQTRFAGQSGEQATFFIADPSGNALEFKAFADMSQVFAR